MHALEDAAGEEAVQEHPSEFEDQLSDRSDLFVARGASLARAAEAEDDGYEPSFLDAEEVREDPYQQEAEASSKNLAIAVPRQPTEEERREREISHLPYRTWCSDRVRGKGLTSAHRSRGDRDEEKGHRRPLIAMDYFYLGRDEEHSLPILGMVEEQTGTKYAICMPEKGVQHQRNIAAVAKVLRVAGCLGGVLRSDNAR